MTSWADFAAQEPPQAAAALRLFGEDREDTMGFLATVGADGAPHLAPVCPIFCGGHLYLCVAEATPKRRDLEATGRYVLHAFLGESDEELQLAGRATRVEEPGERARVQAAIRFVFQPEDPIFRLDLERCLHAWWERPGQPGTRPVRRRWRAASDPRPVPR